MTDKKELSMAIFGEIMMTRRISVYEEPEFLSLIKTLRDADVGVTNIEGLGMNNFKGYRLVGTGGTPMTGESYIADEFKWAGFDIVSIANNHIMDYGAEGLLSAIEALDRAGLAHAGAGRDLTLAREPAYFESKKGRVAMVASTSSSMQLQPRTGLHTMATEAGKGWPGRPGVNPLRYEATYTVSPSAMEELKKANFLGSRAKVVVGDKPGVQYALFKSDYDGNLAQIKEAERQADWVIAANHNDDRPDPTLASEWGNASAEFIRKYAKDCIDGGADVYYGHGDHEGQGIEIYKGKPIFYSLANPICTSQSVRRLPLEEYERYGLSYDSTPTDWMIARYKAETGMHLYCSDRWLQTVMAVFRLDGWHGKLSELKLIPMDAGADERLPNGGGAFAHRGVRPLAAKGAVAKKIIERYAKLSEPFGTEIEFKDGIGVVKL